MAHIAPDYLTYRSRFNLQRAVREMLISVGNRKQMAKDRAAKAQSAKDTTKQGQDQGQSGQAGK
jgi:hypothetical protein